MGGPHAKDVAEGQSQSDGWIQAKGELRRAEIAIGPQPAPGTSRLLLLTPEQSAVLLAVVELNEEKSGSFPTTQDAVDRAHKILCESVQKWKPDPLKSLRDMRLLQPTTEAHDRRDRRGKRLQLAKDSHVRTVHADAVAERLLADVEVHTKWAPFIPAIASVRRFCVGAEDEPRFPSFGSDTDRFREVREFQESYRSTLSLIAALHHSKTNDMGFVPSEIGSIPLLCQEDWLPDRPPDLVEWEVSNMLEWESDPIRTHCPHPADPEETWPDDAGWRSDDYGPNDESPWPIALRQRGGRHLHYLEREAKRSPLWNGNAFRLVRVAPGLRLTFSEGSYFGYYETGEALAYEFAATARAALIADGSAT